MMKSIISVVLTLLVATAQAETVCAVHDGDTFKLCSGQSVRIWGIDAPELKQPDGPQARDYLARLLLGRDVQLKCVDRSYRRQVCLVIVGNPFFMQEVFHLGGASPEKQAWDAGAEMVGRGWAYDSRQYSHGIYGQAEAFARGNHRGVWIDPDGGVRPWDFRRKK